MNSEHSTGQQILEWLQKRRVTLKSSGWAIAAHALMNVSSLEPVRLILRCEADSCWHMYGCKFQESGGAFPTIRSWGRERRSCSR